jgi:hypothetical protein
VPSGEQRKVFQSPPSGVGKIVLATNIAETAITIDDVVYVIDSGRMKEKSYDPYSNVSTLQVLLLYELMMRVMGTTLFCFITLIGRSSIQEIYEDWY